MSKRTPRTAQGFTLLELLVALTLTALILVLLYNGLHFGTRARDLGTARAEMTDRISLVHSLIRRQIHAAQPLMHQDGQAPPTLVFTGTSDRLHFVAPLARSAAGLYEITLRSVPAENGTARQLILEYRPFYPEPAAIPASEDQRMVLLEGAREISFAYYGSRREGLPAAWGPTWQDALEFPQAVRLSVEPERASAYRWPPLIATPKIRAQDAKASR